MLFLFAWLLNIEILFAGTIFSIFIIIPVFLFGTERYMYVGRKPQRLVNIAITGFMAAVAVFVIIVLIVGSKPPVIQIMDDSIEIHSMY